MEEDKCWFSLSPLKQWQDAASCRTAASVHLCVRVGHGTSMNLHHLQWACRNTSARSNEGHGEENVTEVLNEFQCQAEAPGAQMLNQSAASFHLWLIGSAAPPEDEGTHHCLDSRY